MPFARTVAAFDAELVGAHAEAAERVPGLRRSPTSLIAGIAESYEQARAKRIRDRRPSARQYGVKRARTDAGAYVLKSGVQIVYEILEEVYEAFVWIYEKPLTPLYKEIAEQMVLTMCHLCMPRATYEAALQDLMRAFRAPTKHQIFVLMMSRRWGKTTLTSIVLAVIMLRAPGIRLGVFAQSQGITTNNGKLVVAAMRHIARRRGYDIGKAVPTKTRAVGMTIWASESKGCEWSMLFLPGKIGNSYRGETLRLCWIDEADFVDRAVWSIYISPMLSMADTAVVLTSTQSMSLSTVSIVNQWASARASDGFPVVNAYLVRGKCRACEAAEATLCPHIIYPSWIDNSVTEVTAQLFGADIANEMYSTELKAPEPAFVSQHVFEALDIAHGATLVREHTHFFVSVDPGDNASQTAITSLMYDTTTKEWVILAVDALSACGPFRACDAVVAQIKAVRRGPYAKFLAGATAIVVIESNGMWIATTMEASLARAATNYIMFALDDRVGARIGIYTHTKNKGDMVRYAQLLLQDRYLRVAQGVVSSGDPRKAVATLRAQLEAFRKIPRTDAKGDPLPPEFRAMNKGHGENDDMVMSLLLGLFAGLASLDPINFQKLTNPSNPLNRARPGAFGY